LFSTYYYGKTVGFFGKNYRYLQHQVLRRKGINNRGNTGLCAKGKLKQGYTPEKVENY
jgi:hypothetical protein